MLDKSVGTYFLDLENGKSLGDLGLFKEKASLCFSNPSHPSTFLTDFNRAAKAVCLEPKINPSACTPQTRKAHGILSRKTLSLSQSIGNRWSSLSPDDLEKILLGHLRIHTIPSDETMSHWLGETYNRLQDMNAEWLRKSVCYLADLGVYPGDDWIEAWHDAAKQKSAEWGWNKGIAILYRLALLDYLRQDADGMNKDDDGSPCSKAADMFLNFLEKRHQVVFPDKVDSRVYYAALWFKRDFIHRLPIELSQESSSRLEKTVANQIQLAKLKIDEAGIKIGQTDRRIDLCVQFHKEEIGCEVDGVLHFCAKPNENPKENSVIYNVSTRFHAALTRELRPDLKVLRVPYFVLDDAKGSPIFWEKIFGKVNSRNGLHYSLEQGTVIHDMTKQSGYCFKGRTL